MSSEVRGSTTVGKGLTAIIGIARKAAKVSVLQHRKLRNGWRWSEDGPRVHHHSRKLRNGCLTAYMHGMHP